jgi:hypothetical protein
MAGLATVGEVVAHHDSNAIPQAIDATGSGPAIRQGLGWFSLLLGGAEVAATRWLTRTSGLDPRYSTLLRIFGLREITSGIGLLSGRNPRTWMWSRVVGDALDVAFLSFAFIRQNDRASRKRIALSAAAVAPVVALDVVQSLRQERFKAAAA